METTHNLKITNADESDLLDYPLKRMNLHPGTTLSEIRVFLQKDQELSDFIFINSDGFAIPIGDERNTYTKDLEIIKVGKKKKKGGDMETQKEPKEMIEVNREKKLIEHTSESLNYEHANVANLESLKLNGGKVDGEYFSIKDLTSDQLEIVLKGINYLNGFRLLSSGVVSSEKHPFVSIDIPSDFQKYVVKDEKSLRDIRKETSSSKISLMKFGRLDADASLSSPYVGLSGYYSEETTDQKETSHSSMYIFDYYDVRKGFLDLNNYRKFNDDFLNFFKNECDINLQNINRFIQTYGAYVVNSVFIGGKLYTVETATTESSFGDHEKGSTKGIGVKAPIGNTGAVGSGGVDRQDKIKNREENARTNQGLRRENKGGDPLKTHDEDDWRNSLTNYKTWDVIEIVDMKRTIDLLPYHVIQWIDKKFKTVARKNLTIEEVLPGELKEGDYFNIKSKAPSLYFRLTDDNSKIIQDHCGISEDFHWKLKKHNDGSFSIQSKIKDLALQVVGNNRGQGVEPAIYDGSDRQKWYFQKFRDTNFFMIVNKWSQFAIDRYDNPQPGWSYCTYDLDINDNSAFKFELCFNIYLQSDFNTKENWNWFRIRSRKSNMFLRGGGNLDQSSDRGDKSKWVYHDNIFFNKYNDKVIDNLSSSNLFKRSWDNGNPISVWDYNNGSNQKWYILPANDRGWYRIENAYAKKSIDQKGEINECTTPYIWDNDGGNWNQQFRFEKCED